MPHDLPRFKWESLHFSPGTFNVRRCRPFLIILVMIAAAYLAVGIFYKILSLSLIKTKAGPIPAMAIVGKNTAAREPFASYKVIAERNLFGSTDKMIGGKPSPDKAQPASDLSALYDLRGTVAGDGRFSFAILTEKIGKKQKLYKLGDAIGGGRITKIMRNAIAVKVGGEEKIMKIVETSESPILSPTATAGRSLPTTGPSGSMTVNRNDLTSRFKNIGSLLSKAQIRPYFSMGAPDGFLITNIRPGSIYQQLGISNGDIIQGINNQKIRTIDDVMALYNNVINASNVTLNIKRQGRLQNLNYIFK